MYTVFYKKKVYKKMRLNGQNLRESVENRTAQFLQLSVFVGQKSIANSSIQDKRRKCNHSQLIAVKVKKILRKCQAQFREKLRN